MDVPRLDPPKIPVALQRLIDEVRADMNEATGIPFSTRYNRVYHRHNR